MIETFLKINHFISSSNILGITGDIYAHFIIGMILVVLGFRYKFKVYYIFLFVLVVALMKEFFDVSHSGLNLIEHTKDVFFTIIPFFIILYFKLRIKN